jgi:magnesium transporter
MNNPKLHILSATVTKLLHRGAFGPLKKILARRHPAELAFFFRELSPIDQKRLFENCGDDQTKSEVLVELDMPVQIELISKLQMENVVHILNLMDHDDLVDLLEELDSDLREEFLELIKQEDQETVQELMAYDSSTAGGIMNPSYLAFNQSTTAQEAITYLQESSEDYAISFYIYIINSSEKLIGVISLRQLVICKSDTPLKELMTTDVISVPLSMDQEEVAKIVQRYDFLAVPVVDESGNMEGVVTVDDVIDVICEEATEDIFKMAGAGDDILYFQESVVDGVKSRFMGLLFPLIGGLIAALIFASRGEMFLGPALGLLFLFPVISILSSSIASQTGTLIVRGIAMGRIEDDQIMKIVGREIIVGLLLGILFGGISFALSYLQPFSIIPAPLGWKFHVIIGVTLPLSLLISALSGAFLPMFFKRIDKDPATAAGFLLSGIVEVEVITIFILIVSIFL